MSREPKFQIECRVGRLVEARIEWLDKAIAYNDPGISDVGNEPLFAPLHDDPRWLPLLRRVGKAPEQLAVIEFDVALPK